MEAIGLSRRLAWLAALLLCAGALRADDLAEMHSVIGDMATALSNGDAALAISSVSKKCADYEKLSDDFGRLAVAYHIVNQIGFTDEDVEKATVMVHWSMTLETRDAAFAVNREADLTLKFVREGKHWRIISIEPMKIFEGQ